MSGLKSLAIDYSFRLSLPYPEVSFTNFDPKTIAMLSEDYAGKISELSSAAQYTYQEAYTSKIKEISDALKGISCAEMHHLTLLRDAIYTLGGSPRYQVPTVSGEKYFTAEYIDYENLIPNLLLLDIDCEQAAIAQYSRHAASTSNDSVRRLLNRIIADERLHIAILNNLYQKYFS